jgi:hypothetical protein
VAGDTHRFQRELTQAVTEFHPELQQRLPSFESMVGNPEVELQARLTSTLEGLLLEEFLQQAPSQHDSSPRGV